MTSEGTPVDIRTFAASGVWSKPAGATWVEILLVGGSGGDGVGAGGQRRPGGPGRVAHSRVPAAELPDTMPVTVGAGGAATRSGRPPTPGSDVVARIDWQEGLERFADATHQANVQVARERGALRALVDAVTPLVDPDGERLHAVLVDAYQRARRVLEKRDQGAL